MAGQITPVPGDANDGVFIAEHDGTGRSIIGTIPC